jgi:hypothetical protein
MPELMLETIAHSIAGFPVRLHRAAAFRTAHPKVALRHGLIDAKADPFAA